MNNIKSKSGLEYNNFEKIVDNKKTGLLILTNKNGCEVAVTNYGARIVSLVVPDKNGNFVDVVTGHSSIDDYINSEEQYFGAVCGRVCNRIANGQFFLNNKNYQLAINNDMNSLHGGIKGFNAVVWDVLDQQNSKVELQYLSADGEEGFPGNLSVKVTYTLTENNALKISYIASTDKATIINLTNHSYFNLSGEGDQNINDHTLSIKASKYIPTNQNGIPYGKFESVKNTPMDFTKANSIGKRINDDFEQLRFGNGYDHTFIIDKEIDNEYTHFGLCQSPKTGIKMEMFTSQPGVQIYTGNGLSENILGKNNHRYPPRSAVCFETQHYPDSINNPDYPTTELHPGETFKSETTYLFSVVK